MTLKLISGNSCTKLTYSIARYLNIPISHMLCYQRKNKEIRMIIGELLDCDEIFILETMMIESKSVNDILVQLMFITNYCKNNSNAKLSVGNGN